MAAIVDWEFKIETRKVWEWRACFSLSLNLNLCHSPVTITGLSSHYRQEMKDGQKEWKREPEIEEWQTESVTETGGNKVMEKMKKERKSERFKGTQEESKGRGERRGQKLKGGWEERVITRDRGKDQGRKKWKTEKRQMHVKKRLTGKAIKPGFNKSA